MDNINTTFDRSRLIKSISKLKSRLMIDKLKPEELLFLSQIFYAFVKSKYPVPDFYRQRLKEYDPIIGKFARCRTSKSARKLSHHVPIHVFASMCRWGAKHYMDAEENKAVKVTKQKSKSSKPKPPPPTNENEDVKLSRTEIYIPLPQEWNSIQPQTSESLLNSNVKKEEISSFTVKTEMHENENCI